MPAGYSLFREGSRLGVLSMGAGLEGRCQGSLEWSAPRPACLLACTGHVLKMPVFIGLQAGYFFEQ